MTDTSEDNNYIKCSKCRCKYINDDDHIKNDFGYNRLEQRFKTCVKCRNKKKNVKVTQEENDNASTTTPDTVEDDKYIIVMDVETNGFIKSRTEQPHATNLWLFPRIVQFSWGLYTEDGKCKEIKNYIIKPDDWMMNGSDRCHGISQEKAETEGIDIKNVLTQYKNDIDNHCMKVVCHNANFDIRVVASEFVRAKMETPIAETCCTMKEGVNYCKITPKVKGEYKWPSLQELYRKCFDEDLENAHNSYYDVVNCARCYFKLCNEL
jgi:DNA polymerase III epsilon subunit-like protein